MNWSSLLSDIRKKTGLSVISASTIKRISGGDIHQAYHLHTPEADYFLKLNHTEALSLFESEADSLNAIANSQTIACPTPIDFGLAENVQKSWLLMAYLPLTAKGDDFQRGQAIAMMHHTLNQSENGQRYGWHQDNFIGHTPQLNAWHSDWVSFYTQQRLKPQLNWAKQQGAPAQLLQLGNQLIETLPQFFIDYHPKPSLLHGDLWGGNSAFLTDGEPVVYDPASYYGDRETDIAMTELFGGFSDAFYAGYNQVFPLDSGYPQRRPLYQLYPILNHFNLFGGHYAQQAIRIMQSLLRKG